MPDMKLTAEVLLRIEGHDELHNIGTIDVPINVTFGNKPTLGHKPGMRGDAHHLQVQSVQIDESGLTANIEAAVGRETKRKRVHAF